MIKLLLYKWFGLEPTPCATCEVLREQLHKSDGERSELLHKLLDKEKPEPLLTPNEELRPIKPSFVPWKVRQQMLEAEDRKTAQLLRDKQKEMDSSKIEELEKELDIPVKEA